uniref:Uncharacterized protein n=1 Tax=Helianthus annuus TaxID=4232 RepID=A0A251VQ14_HELAN
MDGNLQKGQWKSQLRDEKDLKLCEWKLHRRMQLIIMTIQLLVLQTRYLNPQL